MLKDFSPCNYPVLYQQRGAIENVWKFLKMHLWLDQPIAKSMNGVVNKIYTVLIARASVYSCIFWWEAVR
ncbi:transposase [Thermosynechococcus sp. Uc]|uniref:transposase n=1 Tax=Thermosynechococcus sp. Uc TaxID=3034853 RepID=UPI00345B8572